MSVTTQPRALRLMRYSTSPRTATGVASARRWASMCAAAGTSRSSSPSRSGTAQKTTRPRPSRLTVTRGSPAGVFINTSAPRVVCFRRRAEQADAEQFGGQPLRLRRVEDESAPFLNIIFQALGPRGRPLDSTADDERAVGFNRVGRGGAGSNVV